jgi:hypothetical protein
MSDHGDGVTDLGQGMAGGRAGERAAALAHKPTRPEAKLFSRGYARDAHNALLELGVLGRLGLVLGMAVPAASRRVLSTANSAFVRVHYDGCARRA